MLIFFIDPILKSFILLFQTKINQIVKIYQFQAFVCLVVLGVASASLIPLAHHYDDGHDEYVSGYFFLQTKNRSEIILESFRVQLHKIDTETDLLDIKYLVQFLHNCLAINSSRISEQINIEFLRRMLFVRKWILFPEGVISPYQIQLYFFCVWKSRKIVYYTIELLCVLFYNAIKEINNCLTAQKAFKLFPCLILDRNK